MESQEPYVSKKAGSILFRRPRKHHLVAGDHIPAAVWEQVEKHAQDALVAEGLVEMFTDPDSVVLSEPEAEDLPKVGVGDRDFMPEAKVLKGERKDAALEALQREQEARDKKAKADSEVDPEAGGSRDGVVKVELAPDEDDEDDDDLTDEERAIIEEMEREERGE